MLTDTETARELVLEDTTFDPFSDTSKLTRRH